MVYLHEAFADDTWPVGYGISNPKNLDERQNNCDQFMDKYPELTNLIDAIFLDNMENDFIMKTGAWPEGYFFANEQGVATWFSCSSKVTPNAHLDYHIKALEFVNGSN